MADDGPLTEVRPTNAGDREPAASFTPGMLLTPRFRITALVGRGGMGEVYRADDLQLGQPVALKFLHGGLVVDAVMERLFYDEVRIGRQVAHPNVCRIYDLLHLEGRPAIVMEFVDGEDLRSLMRRVGHLSYRKALDIARDICAGLDAAHEKGIIHGDLKPANVMIDGTGRARIMDFGLCRLAEDSEDHTTAGTLAYMAPEQFEGARSSTRTDLYALGAVLYELFSGRRVRTGRDMDEMKQTLRSVPPPPSIEQPLLDPALEDALLRCLTPDAAARPPNARSILALIPGGDVLDAAVAAGETPSPEVVASSRKIAELQRHTSWLLLGACVAATVTVVLLSDRLTLYGRTDLPLAPAALADRARQTAAEFTGRNVFQDEGYRFIADLEKQRIRFHFRATESSQLPVGLDGRLRMNAPAEATTDVVLSPAGELERVSTSVEERQQNRATLRSRVPHLVYLFLLIISLGAGAYLARRNIRLRRVDRRAAARIAAWTFICRATYGVLVAHHLLAIEQEVELLAAICGASVLLAAQVWIGYAALEPYVRKHWPQTLVGWTRLVQGRIRDALVGRELLAGVVLGLVLRLLDHVRNAVPLFSTLRVTPSHLAVDALTSTREAAGVAFYCQSRAIFYALFAVVLLVLFRTVLRTTAAASAAWLIATTLIWSRWDAPAVDIPVVAAQMALVLFALHRIGLLSVATTIFVHMITVYIPLTADPRAFYFEQSAIAVLLIAAMTLAGFRASFGGRPFLADTV